MTLKKILNLIKFNESFRNIFFYKPSSENYTNNLLNIKPEDSKSSVEWLYSTNQADFCLIGIMMNGKIYKMNIHLEESFMCDSFYDIPFCIMDYFLFKNLEYPYYKDLASYLVWCNSNSIHIDEKRQHFIKEKLYQKH